MMTSYVGIVVFSLTTTHKNIVHRSAKEITKKDIKKLEALLMNRSESIKEIAPALVQFNAKVSKVSKDAANPFHKNKYATLDSIIDAVRPLLQEQKLFLMQTPFQNEDGSMTVKTLVMHESGEFMESDGVTLKLQKNDPQGAGAGITYARRYDLLAFLSLNTGDDDDGNTASGLQQPKPITSKQVGMIKTLNGKVADLKEKPHDEALTAWLGKYKVKEISELSQQQASDMIKTMQKYAGE